MTKKILLAVTALMVLGAGGSGAYFYKLKRDLPQIMKVEDYKPQLVTEVYARGGERIGEFFNQNRILVPYEKIPKMLVNAFLAAEDDQFFKHKGINFQAIFRAMLANMRAGRTVQGGSTITQQVAKSFFLSPEKKLSRKIKEAMLALELESHLRKEDILYLYLNQIFFGEQAYGVAAAAETYFRKSLDELTIAECAMLGGLPQAPSRYSPIDHPQRAKERQKYVIHRMAEVGFITREQAKQAINEPITVYLQKDYNSVAPEFIETVRQMLFSELGQDKVLNSGLKIHTSLDFNAQKEAQHQVKEGLKALDKRQGYRGPLKNLTDPEEIKQFLLATRKKLIAEKAPIRVITRDGNVVPDRPLEYYPRKDDSGEVVTLPDYVVLDKTVEGIVTSVDDKWGLVHVRFAEAQGLIDVGDMLWARKPDPSVSYDHAPRVKKPSAVLQKGDVILVKIVAPQFTSQRLKKEFAALSKKAKTNPDVLKGFPRFADFAYLHLDQEPMVEGSLLSIDQQTQDIVAMIGGYDFGRSKFNRAIQAIRQTGSSFKALLYLAALDKGWTPGKIVADAPIVFEEKEDKEASEGQEPQKSKADLAKDDADDNEPTKKWKPHNYGNRFAGDILFRTALIQSLNIPTVKILEDVGIPWAVDYVRRLGIFSPLNQDLSLSLGSSGITLYEMTKAFSIVGRLGRRTHPRLIHKIVDQQGTVILENISLDQRFKKELDALENLFHEKRKQFAEQNINIEQKIAAEMALTLASRNNKPKDGADAAADTTGETADETTDETSGKTTDAENHDSPSSTAEDLAQVQQELRNVPRIYFEDPDQLIRPTTAYLITSILSGAITDAHGTAGRARALGRPAAGKTGTTNGYFDTWFVAYTPQYATGVWVGFDQEKSLGVGEAGGRTALPIWLEYMKNLHQNIPPTNFTVPDGIVFVNIDKRTGKLASARSKEVVYQAFLAGTEPKELSGSAETKDETDFYKEDLAE